MAITRSQLIDPDRPGTYHLVSRCVRRSFLCGGTCEHRRQWIEDGIRLAAATFAVDLFAFTVMSNHLHLVVHVDPERSLRWSNRVVAERWAALFPAKDPDTGETVPWKPAQIETKANDQAWIATRRSRLASLSWMMRLLLQRIARRANREDGVTGHFWEGRFTSVPLLDQAAVIACMAYNDLNPIRAKMASTPEASDHTSVQLRIQARQKHRKATALLESPAATTLPAPQIQDARERARRGPEAAIWIAPMRATQVHPQVPTISLDEYLELVDATGRLMVSGKRGTIPSQLAPILERLQIDVDRWLDVMRHGGAFLGTAVGKLLSLTAEAARRGIKWIADKTRIHCERRSPVPTG